MILCAAISFKHNEKAYVIPCIRHHYGFALMHQLGFELREIRSVTQGFLTSDNVFLNRREAYIHAKNWKQISPTVIADHDAKGLKELFSEDLY